MSAAPILIIQMQRMGDLVLTFPLLLWLQQIYKDHPLWVVAEEAFFKGLMPLSPQVTFFPPAAAPKLALESYEAVINLSHRPEAASLAAKAKAVTTVGPVLTEDGTLRILGKWQQYRSSIVHNNRHNLFHWAELNALDYIPLETIAKTHWGEVEHNRPDSARIGLFLGASEEAKRPDAAFWSSLAKELLQRGLKPVLLGGPADMPLGYEVSKRADIPALNLCGRFSLEEFVKLTASLRCMITPDTGPMHVAAWTRTPTLNLSMGPVNPWETAPYTSGHYVLRTNISCRGCWCCKHESVLCKKRFSPERVAAMAHSLSHGGPDALERMKPTAQQLLKTTRDANGLFTLSPVLSTPTASPRHTIALFWQAFFGAHLGLWEMDNALTYWNMLVEIAPNLSKRILIGIAGMGRDVATAIKGKGGATLGDNYWVSHPPMLRPLSSYLHVLLQNGDYSKPTYLQALQMLEALSAITIK